MVFLGVLAVIVLLRAPALRQPAVWDGSFSVFPAAATLAGGGFDYPALLDQPGYADGGPNVHALSVVTLVTAIAIRWLGGTDLALPALHALHFVVAAAAGAGLYRIARRSLAAPLAALTAVAGMVTPVVLTQSGDIYLELPVLAATVWAAVALLEDRRGIATAWAVAGALVKHSAVVIGAAVALAILVDPRRERHRLRSALLAAAAPAVVVLGVAALGPAPGTGWSAGTMLDSLGISVRFALRIPDVVALLVAFLGLRPAMAGRPLAGDGGDVEVRRTESFIRCLLASFGGSAIVAGGLGLTTLPRYWTQVVPFIVLGVVLVLRRLVVTPVAIAAVTALCLTSLVNHNGLLYPAVGQNNFPVAERSGEYEALLDVQLEMAAAIEALPDDVPVFYTQAHHYWVTYPESGYVAAPVSNGVNILGDPRADAGRLAEFPADFFVAFESAALGGKVLADLVAQAHADPAYTVVETELTSGEFRGRLVRITHRG